MAAGEKSTGSLQNAIAMTISFQSKNVNVKSTELPICLGQCLPPCPQGPSGPSRRNPGIRVLSWSHRPGLTGYGKLDLKHSQASPGRLRNPGLVDLSSGLMVRERGRASLDEGKAREVLR